MEKNWGDTPSATLNSYPKKLQIYKIEYSSSNNLSFRVGVLCLHGNSFEIKPRPIIQSP